MAKRRKQGTSTAATPRRSSRQTPTALRAKKEWTKQAAPSLARELAEARAQQLATTEVLRIIASSPGELGPVFHTILANATKLCAAKFGALWLYEADGFRA